MFLEKLCISLRFHLVTRQHFFKLEYAQLVSQAIKADHEEAASISFVIHDYRLTIIATNDSKNWLSLYVDWL